MRTHRWRALIPYYAMLLAPPGVVFFLMDLGSFEYTHTGHN